MLAEQASRPVRGGRLLKTITDRGRVIISETALKDAGDEDQTTAQRPEGAAPPEPPGREPRMFRALLLALAFSGLLAWGVVMGVAALLG